MADTIRTFIAIELPAEVRAFLGRCQERLRRAGGDVRWVRPDLIHLTLVFLGDVPTSMLADLEVAVRAAAAGFGPMKLQAAGVGQFPPRGMPRTVWAGVEEVVAQAGGAAAAPLHGPAAPIHDAGAGPVAGAAAWIYHGAGAGKLADLQKSIAEATEAFAEKVEDRAFSPHLTLGRVRGGKDLRTLASAIQAMAAEQGPEFEAREIIIFKSVLAPDRPTYTALARIAISAPG